MSIGRFLCLGGTWNSWAFVWEASTLESYEENRVWLALRQGTVALRMGVVWPLPKFFPNFMAYKLGLLSTYILSGVILQVVAVFLVMFLLANEALGLGSQNLKHEKNNPGGLAYPTTGRWWQLKDFFIFTPKIGEDEPILTSIFFQRGWVETTN